MDCPYLGAYGEKVCIASLTNMVWEENRLYCRTEEHYRCTTLLGHVLRGGEAVNDLSKKIKEN